MLSQVVLLRIEVVGATESEDEATSITGLLVTEDGSELLVEELSFSFTIFELFVINQ